METEKCRALAEILAAGSMTSAAEKLGYTPSGLSRMMASFEEELGFALLIRNRRGVSATAECNKILPIIKEYLSIDRKLAKERERILGLETGTVAVGTAYSVYYKWLSEIIKGFNSRYPGIEVRIVEGKSTKLCDMISEGDMDFAIVSRRENDVKWHHLFFDPLIAVVPNDFCPENGKFNVKNLETHPYIDTYPDIDTDNARMIKKNAIVPNTCFVTEDTYASQRMVEAGLGVSLSNRVEAAERAAVGNVKLLELEPPYLVEIGIAMSDDDKSSPAAGKFKSYAMENINIQKHSISDIIKR